jgi:predicted amidohydrolase
MILDLVTYDPGLPASTPRDYAQAVAERVLGCWDDGADLVLLPEFLWQGLEPLLAAGDSSSNLAEVARVFWHELLPDLRRLLTRPGKAVVLGTCPALQRDGLRNRAPIFTGATWIHQDKLHLTPWEQDFRPGRTLQIWTCGDWRIAVLICLDIEIPELAARLRGREVDLILCPSATESVLGVERVDRCASARAIELGCHVGVAHLTGRATSELIDENLGRAAWYGPSQHVFSKVPRWIEGEIRDSGSQVLRVELESKTLRRMRQMRLETNPAHLSTELAGIRRRIQVQCS